MAAVEFERVDKRFDGRAGAVQALSSVDLSVRDGEFVSLLGPSGCGKSTLLRLVAGLAEPSAGRVAVLGTTADDARRARRVALVPQSPALLPWRTVRGNARLLTQVNRPNGAGPDTGAIDALLDEVGLTAFVDAYPHELSGGMQQRVALVRAFALGAPLLLMDEPFAALDEMRRTEMRHLLVRLWEEHRATVLFVTHSIAEAVLLSDRVVVMAADPGRIVADEVVELARPRTVESEDDPAFARHVARLRHVLAGRAA